MGQPKGGDEHQKGGGFRKGTATKGDWVERRKCHWCDLPCRLVADCQAKNQGKPQKPGLVRKGGRKGDRGVRSLDEDYKSMLGQEQDAGYLERDAGSFEFDCFVCGVSADDDEDCIDVTGGGLPPV